MSGLELSLGCQHYGNEMASWCQREMCVGRANTEQVPGDTEVAHFERDIRVCFAYENEEMLAEGIARLAHVIRSMQDEGEDGSQAAQPTATEEGAKSFW